MTPLPKAVVVALNKRHKSEEIAALYAIGVPTEALCEWFGVTRKRLWRIASEHGAPRPDRSDGVYCHRVALIERINRHIAEYPSVSLFPDLAEAAA